MSFHFMKKVLFIATVLCCMLFVTGALADISNLRFQSQDDGSVLIQWSDTGSGPYQVNYQMDDWSVYYYDTTSAKYLYLNYLIPGQTYTIKVSSKGSSSSKSGTYTVPTGVFNEYKIGKYLNLTETTFSLKELNSNPTANFQVQVSWPRLSRSRTYSAKLVLKTPLGYCGHVFYWDSFEFNNKWEYTYMNYSLMSDWLNYVEDEYESIPTGKYQFEFYVDNLLYGYAVFSLRQ